MKAHQISLMKANGEEPIECEYKFDRIIANLVLMMTEDPLKMLQNLHKTST